TRTPFVTGSTAGEVGTVNEPLKVSLSSPGGVSSFAMTTFGLVTLAGPVHGSSRSQRPSPSVSTTWQVAEQQWSVPLPGPSSHTSPQLPSTTPLPQVVRSPWHAPLTHRSDTVQALPSSHEVPSGCAASAGQPLVAPSHDSAASHCPLDARQRVPAGRFASAGHAALPPLQLSAVSHTSAAGRQTTVAGWKSSAGQAAFA